MRRCDRERISPPWPRKPRDADDSGIFVRRWTAGDEAVRSRSWWDVSDPLHARARHITADECDEHVRCTRTPQARDHLRDRVTLPA